MRRSLLLPGAILCACAIFGFAQSPKPNPPKASAAPAVAEANNVSALRAYWTDEALSSARRAAGRLSPCGRMRQWTRMPRPFRSIAMKTRWN
jgi:hypothetical protein